MLLIGTSATVYPAAGFPIAAKSRGAFLIEVNLYPTPLSPDCDVVLKGPSGEILPRLVEEVREGLKGREG
jgi:NAD-dependent deacetylase